MFNPELPLVSENDGPFTPGITFSYSRTSSEVLLISMCPKSGSIVNHTKLAVQPYGADFHPGGTILFTCVCLLAVVWGMIERRGSCQVPGKSGCEGRSRDDHARERLNRLLQVSGGEG